MKKIIEKDDELRYYGVKVLKILLFLLVIVGIYAIILINKQLKFTNMIWTVLTFISPFFFGVIIAYLLNPLITRMSKGKLNRFVSTSIVYIIILLYQIF